MSGILKIANTIIRRVSSWLRCKCCEDIPSERIIVTEETSRKTNKTNNGKLFVKFYGVYFNIVSVFRNVEIFCRMK